MCVINGRNILRNKAYEPNKKNGYTWQPAPKDERQLYIKGCSCGWCYECRQKNANLCIVTGKQIGRAHV